MSQHYSNPDRESDPFALPDIEVFQETAQKEGITGGWFYWLWPESEEAIGPFATHDEALKAAQEALGKAAVVIQ